MAACGLKGNLPRGARLRKVHQVIRKEKEVQGPAGVGGRDPLATNFSMHDTFKRRLHKILGRAVPVICQDPSAAAL